MDLHLKIEVYQCAAELEQNAAEKIILMINKAIGERGVCSIALSGGETPRPVYRILGSSPIKERIDWSRVHLFFTDERVVPPTDPQSNFGMINREFISHINISSRNIHRIAGEKKPELAAADYEGNCVNISAIKSFGSTLSCLGWVRMVIPHRYFPGQRSYTKKKHSLLQFMPGV